MFCNFVVLFFCGNTFENMKFKDLHQCLKGCFIDNIKVFKIIVLTLLDFIK